MIRLIDKMMDAYWGGMGEWVILKRLFRRLWAHRLIILVAILCMFLYAGLNALPAWYIKDIIDFIENGEKPDMQRFGQVAGLLLLIFVLKGIFSFFNNYLMGMAGLRMIERMRSELYDKILSFSFGFFAGQSSGNLFSRFTSDLMSLRNSVRLMVVGPLRDIPQVFIFLGILVHRSWQLFLFMSLVIPIALWMIGVFSRRAKRFTSGHLKAFAEMNSVLHETIGGVRVVKAFSMEDYERERFEQANRTVYRRMLRVLRVNAYSQPTLETIGAVAGAGIITFGGYLMLEGLLTVGEFTSFLLAFFMLQDPVRQLNSFHMTLQSGIAAAERVFELMDRPSDDVDIPEAVELPTIRDSLDIQVNSYCYPGREEKALDNVHIHIKAGEVVALVGPSGSGKTTLVNLIPRFFHLEDGQILLDGVNINHGTLASLRSQIAIVTQEIFLFNDTIANNIAYGDIHCPMKTIRNAAKAAYAHDFIKKFPKGYDTMVGEGGVNLSGGQRQRIAIARALIKDAPILVLDEATSALDSEAEHEVQKAIEALIKNRTTIVIAHRLSTIRHADRIYVMEGGRVLEHGPHDELIKMDGLYKHLHSMQFRDPEPEDRRAGRSWWRRWGQLLSEKAAKHFN